MARRSERTAAGETAARVLLLLLAAAAAQLAAEPAPPARRPPVRVFRSGGLRAESAALLVSGQEGGEIPLAILALPFPPAAAGADARAAVPVIVEVDGPALLAGQGGDLLRFEVCLYALAAPGAGDGRLASQLTTIEVDLADLRPRIARGGIRFA
ncbi:MAG TPA: hypothetical protein VOA87_09285, partial [Thermoanaerobaculia bacterium]|nr:hypothetical protein [Thermoanaerobaculia bacterium]